MEFNLQSFLNSCPGAVAQGILYGIMAMGVYITYRVLNISDLTVDSSLCTGGSVAAILLTKGLSPALAILCAVASGFAAGLVTGLLHTRLKIPAILSGILTQLALYSVNLRIMGRSNITLLNVKLMISLRNIPQSILTAAIFAASVIALLYCFFGTELGCSVRATGNNEQMARSQGVNTDTAKMIGLVAGNGIVALAGALIAQYQGYSDVNMGRGAIVIGLAGVIIGEVSFGKILETSRISFALRLAAAIFGSVIYYLVITLILQAGLDTGDLKLFSAALVALALGLPKLGKVKGGLRKFKLPKLNPFKGIKTEKRGGADA